MTKYSKKQNKSGVKNNLFSNLTLSGPQDVDESRQDRNHNHDNAYPQDHDHSLAVPVVVPPNCGPVMHHYTAVARLADQTLASMYRGDSVGVKCNSLVHHETLVPPDPDNDCSVGGGLLLGCGPVCVRGGGDGGVSGLQ